MSGSPGSTVSVAVALPQNPGLISAEFSLRYDRTRLELVRVEDTGLLLGGDAMAKEFSVYPYKLFWDDGLADTNNTGTGTVAVLTFRILDDAPAGLAEISISGENSMVIDKDLNLVPFWFSGGGVTVER